MEVPNIWIHSSPASTSQLNFKKHNAMAALRFTTTVLLNLSSLVSLFLLFSPSHSLTCTTQKFTNNKLYANCTDLRSLSAYLHWTYNSTRSSLSIAFIAPPAKSDGWIAWAINPTGPGMVGAQALIAFKKSDGSMTVNTYNISSYSSIVQSEIAFNVSEKSSEYSDGLMKIFATLTLPKNYTTVNQVWQVGGSVSDGMPAKHAFEPANLNAKETLDFVTGANSTITTASAPSATTTTNSTGAANVGVSRFRNCNFGLICSMLLFLANFVLCF